MYGNYFNCQDNASYLSNKKIKTIFSFSLFLYLGFKFIFFDSFTHVYITYILGAFTPLLPYIPSTPTNKPPPPKKIFLSL